MPNTNRPELEAAYEAADAATKITAAALTSAETRARRSRSAANVAAFVEAEAAHLAAVAVVEAAEAALVEALELEAAAAAAALEAPDYVNLAFSF
jgi:hypothetical protein